MRTALLLGGRAVLVNSEKRYARSVFTSVLALGVAFFSPPSRAAFNGRSVSLCENQLSSSREISLQRLRDLSIGTYNLQRFSPKKPPELLRAVGNTILRANVDILEINEVEDRTQFLERFNSQYLNNRYRILMSPQKEDGVSSETAVLVDRRLPFVTLVESYDSERWTDPSDPEGQSKALFTHGLIAVLFRTEGQAVDSRPLFILVTEHLKSFFIQAPKRDSHFARMRKILNLRAAQDERIAQIVHRYRQLYGKDVPIFRAGDRNTASNVFDREKVYQDTGMVEAFEVAQKTLPEDERSTFFLRSQGSFRAQQVDSIHLSQELGPFVKSASVPPDYDANGKRLEREPQAVGKGSDHSLVKAVIDFTGILKQFKPMSKPKVAAAGVSTIRRIGSTPFFFWENLVIWMDSTHLALYRDVKRTGPVELIEPLGDPRYQVSLFRVRMKGNPSDLIALMDHARIERVLERLPTEQESLILSTWPPSK